MHATCPAQGNKSHVLFPMLRFYQRISPGLKYFETFRNNKKFLWWGVVGSTPNPQAVAPPLVGCPQLLIQYICSYPPYPEDFHLQLYIVSTIYTALSEQVWYLHVYTLYYSRHYCFFSELFPSYANFFPISHMFSIFQHSGQRSKPF
jgi:hypothetical protein